MERSLTGTTDSEFDNGWVRLTLTFTVAENNTKAEVFAGIANTTGTVWIDSIQLETGEVANKLNLIKNSGFHSTTNDFRQSKVFPSDQCAGKRGGRLFPQRLGQHYGSEAGGRIPHCRGVYLRWSPSAMVYCAV